MSATAAIFYLKDGYHTSGQKLYGRQAASEGFLKGLVNYGTSNCLYCYTAEQSGFTEFCEQIKPWLTQERNVEWLPYDQPQRLSQPGVLFRPDSVITSMVWERRFVHVPPLKQWSNVCGETGTSIWRSAQAASSSRKLSCPSFRWVWTVLRFRRATRGR